MENKKSSNHVSKKSKIPKRSQFVYKVKSQNNLKIPESQAKLKKGVSFKSEGPSMPEQPRVSLKKGIPDENINRKGILKSNRTSLSKIPVRVKQKNTADLLKKVSIEELKNLIEKLSSDDIEKLAKEHGLKQKTISGKRTSQVKPPMRSKYVRKDFKYDSSKKDKENEAKTTTKDEETKVTKGKFWNFTRKFTKKATGEKKCESGKDTTSDKNAVKGLLDDVISRDSNIQPHEFNSVDITDLSIGTRSSESFRSNRSKLIHIHRSSSDFDFIQQSKRKRRREVSLTPESNSLDDRISDIPTRRSRSASNVYRSPSTSTDSSQRSYEFSRQFKSNIPIRKLPSLDSFSIDSDTDSDTKSPSLDSHGTIRQLKYDIVDVPSPEKDSLDDTNIPFYDGHKSLQPSNLNHTTTNITSKTSQDNDIKLPLKGSHKNSKLETEYRDGKIRTSYSHDTMKSPVRYNHDSVKVTGGSHDSMKYGFEYGYDSPNLRPSNSYSNRNSFSHLQGHEYDSIDDRSNLRSSTMRPSRSSIDLRRSPTGSRYSGLETYDREPLRKNYEDELASIGPSSISPHRSITDLRHVSSNKNIPSQIEQPHIDVISDRSTAKRNPIKDTCTQSQTDVTNSSKNECDKGTNDKSKKKVKFLIDGLISLLHDVDGVEKLRRLNNVKGFKCTSDEPEKNAAVSQPDSKLYHEVSSKMIALMDGIILMLKKEGKQNEMFQSKIPKAKELKRKLTVSMKENEKNDLMTVLNDAINLLHGIVSIDTISKLKKSQTDTSKIKREKTKENIVKKIQPIKKPHKVDIKKNINTENTRRKSKVKLPKSDPVDEISNEVVETAPLVDETAYLLDDSALLADEATPEFDEIVEGDVTSPGIQETSLEVDETIPEIEMLPENEVVTDVELDADVEAEPLVETVAEIYNIPNTDDTESHANEIQEQVQETENIIKESTPEVEEQFSNEIPSKTVLEQGVKSEDLSKISPSNTSDNINSEEINEGDPGQRKVKWVSKSVANLKPSSKKSNYHVNDCDENIPTRPKSVLKNPVKTDGEALKDLLCKLRNNSKSQLSLGIGNKEELKSMLDVIDLDYSEIKKINEFLQLLLKSVDEDVNNEEEISDTGLKIVRETKSLYNLKSLGNVNEHYKKRDKVLENEILQKYLTESDDSVEILSRFYEATSLFNKMTKKPAGILKKKTSMGSLSSVKTMLSADQVKVDRQSNDVKDTLDIQSHNSDQSKSNKQLSMKKKHSKISFKNEVDSAYSGNLPKPNSSKFSKLRFSIKNLKQRRTSKSYKGLRPKYSKLVRPPLVQVPPPFLTSTKSKTLHNVDKKASDVLHYGSHTVVGSKHKFDAKINNNRISLDDEIKGMVNDLNEEYFERSGRDKLYKKKSTSSLKSKKIEESPSLEKYLNEIAKIDKEAQKKIDKENKRAEKEKKSKEKLNKKLEAQRKKSADKLLKKESADAKKKMKLLKVDTKKTDEDEISSTKSSESVTSMEQNSSHINISSTGETDASHTTVPQNDSPDGSTKSKDSADKGPKTSDPSLIISRPSKERTEVTKLDTSSKVRRNPKGRIEEIISITYLKTRGTQYDVSHMEVDNNSNKVENPTNEAAPVVKENSVITIYDNSVDNTPSSPDPHKAFAKEKAKQDKRKPNKGPDVRRIDTANDEEIKGSPEVNKTGKKEDRGEATGDAVNTDGKKGTVDKKQSAHTQIIFEAPHPKQARKRNRFSKDQVYRDIHEIKDGEDKGTETKASKHRSHESHHKYRRRSRHRKHSKLSMISEEPRRHSRHRGSHRSMRRYSLMQGDGGGDDIKRIFKSDSSSSDIRSASSSYSSNSSHCQCFRSAEFLLKRRCCEQQYVYGNNNSCFTKLLRGLIIIVHRVADIFMCCFPGDCRRKRCF
ncbi:hypothetical protein JYU34_018131 [Plutella xylostella]|uniref:Uncharacterized protein n=1 Tax=Plutella xylostella TaxID=51655 RepID=A0ABQ7PZT6_PLUXY|nr:hypothetical protein JYU34_018131 [Plutella xylostella]